MLSSRLVVLVTLVLLPAGLRAQPGACAVNDLLFQTAQGGCLDVTSNRVWSATGGIGTWDYAKQYSDNLVEGGFADWRLPTLAELTALHQHGGATHLAGGSEFSRIWSSTTRGNRAWYLDLQTGQTGLSLKGSSYWVIAVRTPSGPSSNIGGGQGNSTAAISVSHFHGDRGWTVAVHAPEHAYQPYLLFAGAAGTAPNSLPVAPFVLTPALLGAHFFDPGAGRLDGQGRAVVAVDLLGLRVPASSHADLRLVLLLLDPRRAPGVLVSLTPDPSPTQSTASPAGR